MVGFMDTTDTVLLFVDDGHPEARDYDDNYVEVALRLVGGLPGRVPPGTGPQVAGASSMAG